MHLDRLARRLKVPQCIQQVMASPVDPSVGQPVRVKSCSMLFCDPNTYPDVNNVLSIDGWVTAFGYHPRHTTTFDVLTKMNLEKLMMSDAVMVAYEEIGLDRTEPNCTWRLQESVLKQFSQLTTVNKAIVLHVRGEDSINGSGVPCLTVSRKGISQFIFIVLAGSRWRQVFPNTHFEFAGNVRDYSQEQKEGIR